MEGPKSTKNLPVFGLGLGFEWALGLKYPRKATVPYLGFKSSPKNSNQGRERGGRRWNR